MLAALCISRPREKAARRAQVKNWLSFGGQCHVLGTLVAVRGLFEMSLEM